ncbi:hypothetical protein BKI52_30785 [marine bacterium AO1-C]|nr:hypothetical protein BKI52_30785 [marine bacterium AO1-C]
MKSIAQLLLITLIAFSLQSCGGGEKANDTTDTTSTTTDTTANTNNDNADASGDKNSSTTKTEDTPTNDADAGNEADAKLTQQLMGTWGDKPNMSQFDFMEGNKFKQYTPVAEINGTFSIKGGMLTLEGTQEFDGNKTKVSEKYKIEKIEDKKSLTLSKTVEGSSEPFKMTLRFGESIM